MTANPDSSALSGTEMLPDCTPATAIPTVYPRRDDGSVHWRAMVKPEHTYVKKESKEAAAKLLNRPVTELYTLTAEDVAKLPDGMLVIRKAGILELARLRGYTFKVPTVQFAQRDYVIVRTEVHWNAFEGTPAMVTGGIGEAGPENTTELGSRYLAANAENRAFARAVRDLLEIDIVSSDELGKDGQELPDGPRRVDSASSASSSSPASAIDLSAQGTLTRAANAASFTFEQVKNAAVARWKEDSENLTKNPALANDPSWRRRIENDPTDWADFSGIPSRDCLTLINLIKGAKAAREAAAKAKEEAAAQAAQAAATPHVAPHVTPHVETPATEAEPEGAPAEPAPAPAPVATVSRRPRVRPATTSATRPALARAA